MARNSSLMRISKEFEKEVNRIYKTGNGRVSKIKITREFAKIGSMINVKSKQNNRDC